MTFNLKNYEKACREQDEHFSARDEHLYSLCRKHPHHDDLKSINAKLYIIGRTYATGIERKTLSKDKGKSEGQGQNLIELAKYFYDHRKEISLILKRLSEIAEPLDKEKLEVLIEEHGRFVQLLQKTIKNKQNLRSFASKYLHFHCPAMPIFDSWANSSLTSLYHWKDSFEVFGKPSKADEEYHWFILRFWQLYLDARRQSKTVTVKYLDNYLLWNARNET